MGAVLPESLDPKKVKLSVFVSYAREDLEFADQLVAALGAFGFSAIIDRKGIQGAENWKRRLGQLILESDAVVFVLTPSSVQSPVAQWEVDQALRLNKRVLPVIAAPLGAVEPYEPLRDLNYIHFHPEPTVPGSGFGTGVALLTAALSVDIAWTREHTRVGSLAARWNEAGRTTDLLLRGSELTRVKQWRDMRPPNAPELTNDHRDFIQASEDVEKAWAAAQQEQLEERTRALRVAEEAQQERRKALEKLSRRTWFAVTALALLAIAIGAGLFQILQQKQQLLLQNRQLAERTKQLEIVKQETAKASEQLENDRLRLQERMNLKIANTEHSVTTTSKWYRVATDYKLSFATFLVPWNGNGEQQVGSGFLIQGGGLRPEWNGRVVYMTAAHVISTVTTEDDAPPDLSHAFIAFPGVGENARVKLSQVLFKSRELDVAVLGLAGPPPRHAQAVDLPSQVAARDILGAVAVLQWTAQDGFALGFGHGVPKPASGFGSHEDRWSYTHVTGPGASGAPVFDADTGRVVCLHQGSDLDPQRPLGFCTSMAKIVAAVSANK